MQNIYDIIMARRTVRKFRQDPVKKEILLRLMDAARMAPTGSNKQPLSFGIITDKQLCAQIFPNVGWAGYLKGTYTPAESERPTAYICVFADEENKGPAETAAGAAIENILILAQAEGLGCCWMGAINRDKIKEIVQAPREKYLLYLIALGYPAESPKAVQYSGDVKYFLDDSKILNVPKKSIKDVLILDK
ncbi:MAG: nitroreductase family protein [Treponema sp.]|nr:nitroreductase family protein [Treponema sp.]